MLDLAGSSVGHGSAATDAEVATRPADYFTWVRAVRDADPKTLPAHVKGTLFILSTYANGDGRGAFPSAETMASKLGKTERSVREDAKTAVGAGYLLRHRPNRQKTYRYVLTIPFRADERFRSDESTGSRVPLATGHGLPDTYSEDLPLAEQTSGLFRVEEAPYDDERF